MQLEFGIDACHTATRELHVRVRLSGVAADEVELLLPTWTPGSYLIREYARQLSRVEAFSAGGDTDAGAPLPCRKDGKNRFVVTTGGRDAIELRYRVYAHELSVRTAHVDQSRAFWTPACLLLWPVGAEQQAADIVVEHPSSWTVTCALPCSEAQPTAIDRHATRLRAADMDDAFDAPVLVGAPQVRTWTSRGVPHRIAIDGLDPIAPPESLTEDLARIVDAAADVFGGALPYEHYTFLALFTDDGYGGLEHRASSVLLMARTTLSSERGYRDFLGLAAHELFHAWNVKRMRPVEFWRYDYERENHTRLLWVMEGWTAYYDDLLVVRAGLMSHDDYLATMAKNVQNLENAPGRFELSLEESSHDAWIRLYRPDENTRNSSQNYYGNGAVAAMCLDLLIRRETGGARSLDDVLRRLYESTFGEGRGYTADDVHRVVQELAGDAVVAALRSLVTGDLDPELDGLLVEVGVRITHQGTDKPYLGVNFKPGTTQIASVTRGGPAFVAGLAPGDEVLAVQSVRTTAANWQSVFGAVAAIDQPAEVLVARRGIVTARTATPTAHPGKVELRTHADATATQVAARNAWLGEPAEPAAPKRP